MRVMPKVHDAHPSTNFELISLSVIDEWEFFPYRKLAAKLFGIKTKSQLVQHYPESHFLSSQGNHTKLGVSAPEPNARAISMKGTPITFLISDFSETACQILLGREVWSPPEVTFRVIPLEPSRPNFLFAIDDLPITEAVREAVRDKWQDDQAQTFFQLIPQDMTTDDNPPQSGHCIIDCCTTTVVVLQFFPRI